MFWYRFMIKKNCETMRNVDSHEDLPVPVQLASPNAGHIGHRISSQRRGRFRWPMTRWRWTLSWWQRSQRIYLVAGSHMGHWNCTEKNGHDRTFFYMFFILINMMKKRLSLSRLRIEMPDAVEIKDGWSFRKNPNILWKGHGFYLHPRMALTLWVQR